MKNLRWGSAIALACLMSTAPRAFGQHEHGVAETAKIGSVDFQISCDPAVRADFNRGVALLHSFWYRKASETFAAIAKADPSCGMAEWGVAMSHYRQLWDPPTPTDLQLSSEAVQKAQAAGAKTQRERDYIAAMETFYKDPATRSQVVRSLAYEKAMEGIYVRYPQDYEAAIFYALALRANAPEADKTYANQKKASAILEKLFVEHPEHPGLAHYIIHCNDYPSLAPNALDAARRYSKIAPEAPHALHMPSHIFTRLGLWQESIDSNVTSSAAAKKNGLVGDALHAMDYLAYAYLQEGRDRDARAVLETMPRVQSSDPAYYAGLFATASIPSRYALERHNWAEAAALQLTPEIFPGGRYAWTESSIYFARALGAARMGSAAAARADLQDLISLRDKLLGSNDGYSAGQVDIQRESVSAWISFAEGSKEDALAAMKVGADHEDATDTSPVTPGAILPARELYGEMLLESGKGDLALKAFETSLRNAPARFHSVYGAARAAKMIGDKAKAAEYFAKLLTLCAQGDGERPEIQEASASIKGK